MHAVIIKENNACRFAFMGIEQPENVVSILQIIIIIDKLIQNFNYFLNGNKFQ